VSSSDSNPGGERVTLTPGSHVKFTLLRFWVILAGVVVAVAVGVGAVLGVYNTLTTQLSNHIADKDRHLEPEYQRDHGRPVGKWDIDVWRSEINERFEKQQQLWEANLREIRAERHGR
jgi:hypothetical protein